jgi:hypothetical protein
MKNDSNTSDRLQHYSENMPTNSEIICRRCTNGIGPSYNTDCELKQIVGKMSCGQS